jgi:Trk-type K+ transport system membrane component
VGTFSLMCFFWGANFELAYFRQWEPAQRALNGWLQAVMVYNAGFNAIDISRLSQATLLFTLATMWYTGRPGAALCAGAERDGARRGRERGARGRAG